ncbi:MaoC family dehydratase [Rugamonas apoptosis]|uniref:MaoC family dehydratase n=1 Tax=Rugamonas apoptosis TaxID=2758570 RepID=A0A7W2F7U4_9BURK|nr:MaoC family dehydratase [Rugamonas apoptosis]MBA5686676.1 MaoC family dehydratase [Rugamonas apoptosis]
MAIPEWDQIEVGAAIPALTLAPVNRTTLALFAGASGDHNPIHIDLDFARKAGLPDVFAHGMLGMAWLGRMVTNWVPQAQLKRFEVRFLGLTQIGHIVSCSGTVSAKSELNGVPTAQLQIQTTNQYGETRIAGEALVVFPFKK